jgi:hypothetical protein
MEPQQFLLSKEQIKALDFKITPEQLQTLHSDQRQAMVDKFKECDRVPGGLIEETIRQFNGLDSTVIGAGVELRPTSMPCEGGGKGLFANRGFFKGSIITEYCGNTISHTHATSLPKNMTTHHYTLLKHCLVIDGLKDPCEAFGKGGASFCNDPRNKALYNCKLKTNEITNRVFIVATRDIGPGEEFFFPYGKIYWKKWEGMKWEIDPMHVPGRVRSMKDLNRSKGGVFKKGAKVLVRKTIREEESGKWQTGPRREGRIMNKHMK